MVLKVNKDVLEVFTKLEMQVVLDLLELRCVFKEILCKQSIDSGELYTSYWAITLFSGTVFLLISNWQKRK